MNASDAVSIIGALGVGSFIGQYLIGSHQRRQTRSLVLAALQRIETARWVSSASSGPSFREAMHELETAALIARIPKRAVVHYKILATVAFLESHEGYERDPDDEYAGGINSELAQVVQLAASEVARLAWSPWLARLGLSRRIGKQIGTAGTIAEGGYAKSLKRAAGFGP